MGTLIILPAMGAVITIDVILRYVFKSPLLWSQEFNGLFLLAFFFSCLAQCWNEKKHVSMQLFAEHFKGPMKKMSEVAGIVTGLIFFGLIGYQSIRHIPYMIKTHETGEFFLAPFWLFKGFAGLCSILLCIQLVFTLFFSFSKPSSEEDS
jgi:TRAP-type C4-dicarboxylate transport system permease small subunit